ncbi:MAG: phage protease [Verrucomicrobiota bacterium]
MPVASLFKHLTNRTADSGKGSAKFALPEDGFIQMVPKGTAPNVRHNGEKILQLVDDAALVSMFNRLLEQGGEILVDFEHFSHDPTNATDAAAWVPCDSEHLQNRADGLYGRPRWSEDGEAAVTGGRLRFISPEFPDTPETLVNVEGKTWRPLAVTGFGLTNRPGFRSQSKALTNSDRPEPADKPTHPMHQALLALALGLPETEVAKLDETTLRNRVQVLTNRIKEADAAAEAAKKKEEAEADAFMKKHEGLAPLKNKAVSDNLRTLFLNNREAAEELVKGFQPAGDGLTDAERERANRKSLHNRENATTPPANDADEKRARKINAKANQILANREEPTWATAFQRAKQEVGAD